ncbi:MAG: hypothetical protein KAI24_24530 [Planctomycetes bacterium]|nr:hypothetical protein [Planctomycetota bacterium]
MKTLASFALLTLTAPALAQNFYLPDSNAAVGTCNVIPFGQSTAGGFYNGKMQLRATAAELGGVANLITGLGFACCSSGDGEYGSLTVVMDHIPPSQATSATFANNLTPAAQTVLDVQNHVWNITANAWNEIGLQDFFVFNGVDDVIIEITSSQSLTPGGMRRGTRPRLYWFGSSGPAAPTGTLSNTGTKIEISMLTARTSTYGRACTGSNGAPLLGFSGSAQVGNTLSFDLINGVQNGVAILLLGTTNAAPFPIDLGSIGMPGCYSYTDLAWSDLVVCDAAGSATFSWQLPTSGAGSRFYAQYACLDLGANALGFTMTNYGRVLAGN